MAEEFCQDYRSSLEDLKFNSKPLINMLTMLADDNIAYAPKIVQVIETHLRKVKPEHKLPIIYLVDSILKNIGKGYLSLFRQNIVSNFCSVFEKGDEKVRMMLFKLRQTWSEVFSSQKLNAIDVRVNQLDPAWPVNLPSSPTSVHVNPKFLGTPASNEGKPESKQPPQQKVAALVVEELSVKNQDLQEAEMREQLIAKQQELLRLQQQKLELELLQTKARLDEQARQLQVKERQLKHVQSQQNQEILVKTQDGSSKPVSVVKQPVPTQVSNQPQTRDPRLSANAKIVGDQHPNKDQSIDRGVRRDPRVNKAANSRDPRINSKLRSIVPLMAVSAAIDPSPKVSSNGNECCDADAKASKHAKPCRSSSKAKSDKRKVKGDSSAEKVPHKKASKSRETETSPKKQNGSGKSPKSRETNSDDAKVDSVKDRDVFKTKRGRTSPSPTSKKGSAASPLPTSKKGSASKKSEEKRKSKVARDLNENYDDMAVAEKAPKIVVDVQKIDGIKQQEAIVSDEPPKKKKKADLDDLFGSQDQDYRSSISQPNLRLTDMPHNDSWAKYKNEHREEYKSPLKPRNTIDDPFGFGKEDMDLRQVPENKEEQLPSRRKWESSVQMNVMVKNQGAILKQFGEQLRLGQINEQEHQSLMDHLDQVVKLQHERKKQMRVQDRSHRLGVRKIMIDNKMREIRFENGCGIVNMDDLADHLIYFKGRGRNVFIDDQEIFLNFNGQRKKFSIGGSEHAIMFGGPTRELYIDDVPYEGRFGGPAFGVTINSKVYRARLQGPPPDVDVKPLQNRDLDPDKDHADEALGQSPRQELRRFGRRSPVDDDYDAAGGTCSPRPKGSPKRTHFCDGGGFKQQEIVRDPHVLGRDAANDNFRESPVRQDSQRIALDHRQKRQKIVKKIDTMREDVHHVDVIKTAHIPPLMPEHRRRSSSPHNFRLFPNQDVGKVRPPEDEMYSNRQRHHGIRNARDDDGGEWNRERLFERRNPNRRSEKYLREQENRLKRFGNSVRNHGPRLPFVQGHPLPQVGERSIQLNDSRNQIRPLIHGGGLHQIETNQLLAQGIVGNLRQQIDVNKHAGDVKVPQLRGNQFASSQGIRLPVANLTDVPRMNPNVGGDVLPIMMRPPLPPQQLMNSAFPQDSQLSLGGLKIPAVGVLTALKNPMEVSTLFEKLLVSGIITKSGGGGGYSITSKDGAKNKVEPVVEGKKEEVVEETIPLIVLGSSQLKIKRGAVIRKLYSGLKCESCGVRFLPDVMDKYSQHLDWHFRSNRREKDGAKKAVSRKWYYEVEDWIQYEEIEDLEERAQSYFDVIAAEEPGSKVTDTILSVSASDNEELNACMVCGERFELFWVEDEESWHLKDALRINESTYHPLCYEDSQKRLEGDSKLKPSMLPGLDLLPPEDENDDIKMDVDEAKTDEKIETTRIKSEPVDSEETGVEPIIGEVRVKSEPVDPDVVQCEPAAIKVEATDVDENELAIESAEDDKPSEDPPTPLVDEGIVDPPTPLVDESQEERVRPEPERIKIEPITGSTPAISLNLCKSTVDSGLRSTNKESDDRRASQSDTETEDEMKYPPPDPRFQVQEPVFRGNELSGLCSIM